MGMMFGPDGPGWNGRRVLVAGGAGMIGSYLVEELVAHGATVRVADNLERGSLANLAAVRDRIELLTVDLRDRAACAQAVDGMDLVCNLAARTAGIGYSARHQGEMLTVNTTLSLNLLEAARERGVERFLVVSSSCVYPDDAPAPTPELPVLSGLPERGNEGYGWAKRVAELQARFYAEEHGMHVTIVRPFNPYAPRYRWEGEASHVVPSLVKKICDGVDPLVVWGSGRQRRNLLHARDVAALMRIVVERHHGTDPVNLGTEETVSVAELVAEIAAIAGRSPRVVYDTTRPEGRGIKSADATRLRSLAPGYQPAVSRTQGLAEMIAWHRATFVGPSGPS